jgi:hypothetical protein
MDVVPSSLQKRSSPPGVEVTVLNAQNVPQKPVLGIRVGSALRHVDLNVNAPFRIAARDVQDCSRVNVSLYQQLGTQQILDVDETESICSVPVRVQDGGFSQVKLRIRRGRLVPTNFLGTPADFDDYFGAHQLEAHLQRLFELVLKTQPADPYQCMIEELRKIKEKDVAAKGTRSPKVPVAPSSEAPARPRPSALKCRSKMRLSESQEFGHFSGPFSPLYMPRSVRDATNREIAHEIMRSAVQRFCKITPVRYWTLGERHIKRAYGTDAAYYARRLVFAALSNKPEFQQQFQPRSHTSNTLEPTSEQSLEFLEARAEARELAQLVKVRLFSKAAELAKSRSPAPPSEVGSI